MRQMLDHGQVKKVEKALHLSSAEGAAYGGMVGFGEYFLGAYAVALRATSFEIGLLSAVPNLFGAIGHAISFRAARWLGTRKRVVVLFALLQGAMWLPMVGLGQLGGQRQVLWLVGVVAAFVAFGAIVVPCWNSIMAEVLPQRVRGRYFGFRSLVSTLSTVITSLLGGVLVYLLRDHGLLGFAIAFLAAMGFRIVSVLLLTTLLELHTDVKAEEAVPLKRFLKEVGGTNLGRAMILLMLMSFMVNLAGPHFTPYMLRDLRLDYFTFSIMEVAAAVGAVLTVTHWGFAADRAGNRRMLCVAGVLVSLVPLLWLVSSNIVYLAVVQVYTGFAWAGFNLTSVNFLFDATTDRNRTAYLSLFNAGAGIVGTLGALIGGALVTHLPVLFGLPVLMLFALSGGLRLGVAIAFVSVVREVRRVSTLSALEVFHLMVAGKPAYRTASHGRTFRIHDPQPVRRKANGEDNDLSAEWRRISDLV